jgi:septal ring-binding cell division protein DamX
MSLNSTFKPIIARSAAALFLLAATSAMTVAQTETPASDDYAILIVGDESDAEVLRKEKVLIQEMAKSLKKQSRLPIYSYHFNKERERSYCEKKLNVLREDLLFIGIVSLKDRVPRKIVYRLDRIVTPSRAAADIILRADELLAPDTSPSPSPSLSPDSTPSTSPSPNPGGAGKFRVQLAVFTQQKTAQDLVDRLKVKGYEAKVEKMPGDAGKEVFKVWVGTFQTKEDAQQASTELQADGFEKGFVVEGP